MGKILLSFLILLITSDIFAQEYFPLAVGNRWEFQINEWDGTGQGSRDTVSMIIIDDTLMSNGYKYFLTNHTIKVNDFFRIDSLGVYFYDTINNREWLFFKYDGANADEYPWGEYISVGYMMNNLDSSHFIRIYKWNDGVNSLLGNNVRIITYFVDTGQDNSYQISISPQYGFIGMHESNLQFNYDLFLIGCILDNKTYGTITNVDKRLSNIEQFSLSQNYPNPFNPTTKIKYTIPSNVKREMLNVNLTVYDILGNEVATLVNEEKPAGSYEVSFSAGSCGNGINLSSGIYFYVLKAGGTRLSRKMCLIK